jgi:xanthosine utilization system XapX-like protein
VIGLGFWGRRTHREIADSWTAYGTGLAIGLLPTVSVGIGNDDTTRLILGAGAAAAVLFVGARARLRAPVVIAASVLAVLAGDQLVDVATQIPRWVTFAVLGAVCVGLGATADRQLDRVRRVRHTLHSMQ